MQRPSTATPLVTERRRQINRREREKQSIPKAATMARPTQNIVICTGLRLIDCAREGGRPAALLLPVLGLVRCDALGPE